LLFKKNEPAEIDPVEGELTTLTNENAELSKQSAFLHGKAITTTFKPEKDKIMAERAELETKISHNRDRLEQLKEQEALTELVKLMRRHIHDVRVNVNGSRVKIADNLNVTIPFEGCNHSLNLPVFELLRVQTTLKLNRHLLACWQTNINNDYTTHRQLLCQHCVQEKKRKLKKEGVYQPTKRSGTARIEIIVFR
jgi:hypothetical protein